MKSVLGNKKSIAVFVLPAFIIYAVFALFPIAYNIYMSLFKTDLMSGREFVGLKNYIGLFKDATFTHALGNNILMVIGSLIAHMPLAMFFANAIFNQRFRIFPDRILPAQCHLWCGSRPYLDLYL
mgnify:CR=1 FL=1